MTETSQNFAMYEGTSLTLRFTVTQNDEAVDLEGSTITWVAVRRSDLGAFLQKEAVIDDDPGTGVFTVELEPEDTEDLAGRYLNEAKMVDAAGEVFTVTTGLMSVWRSLLSVAA